MKRVLFQFGLLFFPLALFAQNSMPSNEELAELLSNASQKITSFQEAVQGAKPYLDQQDPKLVSNYMDTAKTAEGTIKVGLKEGASAYRLVGLLSLLDDMTVDASNASFRLMQEDAKAVGAKRADIGVLAAILPLNGAQTGLNDISELILHATLRYVGTEEQALTKLLDAADKAK